MYKADIRVANAKLCCGAQVRFWHKADVTIVLDDVRFRGVKRTVLVFNHTHTHTAAKSRLQVICGGRGKRELVPANNALGFAAEHERRHR
jgi:hypothetical protein